MIPVFVRSTVAAALAAALAVAVVAPASASDIAPSPTPSATAPSGPELIGRALPWVLGGLASLGLGAAGVLVQYQSARRRSQP